MNIKHLLFLVFLYLAVFSVTVATPQDSLKVTPANPEQGALSIYQLNFVTTDTLYPTGQISITFTDDFDLSMLTIANSTTINGGFKVEVQGNKVFLKRTGLGLKVMPKERVEIKFANIRNPANTNRQFQVKIEFQNQHNQQIQKINELTVGFTAKIAK